VKQTWKASHPVEALTPHPDNPRRGDVGAIQDSISAHGFYGAILAQQSSGRIIAGEHRWQAAQAEGLTKVPVVLIDCDDAEAVKIMLADNRTSDAATYDGSVLASILSDLDGDLIGTGYNDDDLATILEKIEHDNSDEKPDHADTPIQTSAPEHTKPGDVFMVGDSMVVCGDCRDGDFIDKVLDGRTINLAITSPPYADRRKYDETTAFKPIPPNKFVEWFAPVADNVKRNMADDGSWFVNIKAGSAGLSMERYVLDLVFAHIDQWGWNLATEFCWERVGVPGKFVRRFKNGFEPVYQFTQIDQEWKFNPEAVRTRSTHVPQPDGSGGWDALANLNTSEGWALPSTRLPTFSGSHESVGHSAAYPVGLPEFFIKAYTDPDDIVYDPFGGSGSTLLAAHRNNRAAVTIEISPTYCDMALLRIQKSTGVVPTRNGKPVSFIE
jgi:DNA modification methylase